MRSMLYLSAVGAALALAPCTFTTTSGSLLNFTSLINSAGAYRWQQPVFNTEGNLFAAIDPTTATNYTYELQICNPVTASVNVNCTAGSMINQIGPDGSCLSFGRANVATFNQNPYNDGAYIAAYNGDSIDNVDMYSAHVYLICDASTQVSPPVYEHMKATYQVHFSINTKLAC